MKSRTIAAGLALYALAGYASPPVAARKITPDALAQLIEKCVYWVHLQGAQHPSHSIELEDFDAYFDPSSSTIFANNLRGDYYFEKCMALNNFPIGNGKSSQ